MKYNKISIIGKTSVKIILPYGKFYITNITKLDKICTIKEYINQNPNKKNIILMDLLKNNYERVYISEENVITQNRYANDYNLKIEESQIEKSFHTILRYSALYPAGIDEVPPPKEDFKHRYINNLLESDGYIFQELLNNLTYKNEIHILINIMRMSEILKMNILFQKIGAIIAMKIKDKPIEKIQDVFT